MKIAYLIAAHDNYAHLRKLVDALNDDNVFFYIHIDKKKSIPHDFPNLPNLSFIENRVKVYWAGFSQVRATLSLLNQAIKENYDYYILISGVDYPIRPNKVLYQLLNEGGEFLETIEGFSSHKPEKRINRYSFDCFNRRDFFSVKTLFFSTLELGLGKMVKRKFPFKAIYQGSNWFALTHSCISYILEFVKNNPEYCKFYSTTRSPDESFFHTIIGNSPFLHKVRPNLTFADWSEKKSGPAIINASHVSLFKEQDEFEGVAGRYKPFFARKFNDDSAKVVELIEKELRYTPSPNSHNTVSYKHFNQ